MSDIDGAAAPAESAPAPAPVTEDVAVSTPNPITTEPRAEDKPKAEPEPKAEDKKPLTTREALARAREKVEAEAKAAKPEVKTEAKTEPKADVKAEAKPEVKTAAKAEPAKVEEKEPPKPSHTAGDPPARFTDTAKAKWASADPEIRGEVSRMERELTEGYKKYKEAAERDTHLHEFHEMAKQSGKELHGVVREYVQMEQLLAQDLPKGIETILNRMGVTPRQYAEHILGQAPDQVAGQQEQTIAELRRELAEVKQSVGQVTQTFQQQQMKSITSEIEAFASKPEHYRFDELADTIAFLMQDTYDAKGKLIAKARAQNLPEAYQLAERLNPAPKAPALTPAASSAPAILDLQAQTDKGQKSINGSPDTGSDPTKRQPSKSIRDSVTRAYRQAS